MTEEFLIRDYELLESKDGQSLQLVKGEVAVFSFLGWALVTPESDPDNPFQHEYGSHFFTAIMSGGQSILAELAWRTQDRAELEHFGEHWCEFMEGVALASYSVNLPREWDRRIAREPPGERRSIALLLALLSEEITDLLVRKRDVLKQADYELRSWILKIEEASRFSTRFRPVIEWMITGCPFFVGKPPDNDFLKPMIEALWRLHHPGTPVGRRDISWVDEKNYRALVEFASYLAMVGRFLRGSRRFIGYSNLLNRLSIRSCARVAMLLNGFHPICEITPIDSRVIGTIAVMEHVGAASPQRTSPAWMENWWGELLSLEIPVLWGTNYKIKARKMRPIEALLESISETLQEVRDLYIVGFDNRSWTCPLFRNLAEAAELSDSYFIGPLAKEASDVMKYFEGEKLFHLSLEYIGEYERVERSWTEERAGSVAKFLQEHEGNLADGQVQNLTFSTESEALAALRA